MISPDERATIDLAQKIAKEHPDRHVAVDSFGHFTLGRSPKEALSRLQRKANSVPPYATAIHRVDTTQPIAGCRESQPDEE